MPELPEVETTRISLAPLLNQTISKVEVHQPKLRWQMPDDLTSLVGYKLINAKRRAKYLILTFGLTLDNDKKGDDNTQKDVIIHLGMSGSLQQHPEHTEKRKHDHLIISFGSSEDDSDTSNVDKTNFDTSIVQLHYHDPRRFGAVLWADETSEETENYRHKLLNHLGVEPLTDKFSRDYLYQYIHHHGKKPISKPIKSVIMEQKVVVGVGNIYATESLFMTGINPNTPANNISKPQINSLVKHIKAILKISIEKGGSSLKDFSSGNGKTGYFQQTLLAYGRKGKPCVNCPTLLVNSKINQRASVYCPDCQPLIY